MWIYSHTLPDPYMYSNCKCANWVLQAFLRPSLVPKCDTCYLKNKCCYTYSNSKLVTLSHTYVTCFTRAFWKLSHALIKHKNSINYILPSASHLPKYIDPSQLCSLIHISQIMNLYHIPLIITSQYKLNRWTNSFLLFELFDRPCMVCLCYAISWL
jgi:hypothetical protein